MFQKVLMWTAGWILVAVMLINPGQLAGQSEVIGLPLYIFIGAQAYAFGLGWIMSSEHRTGSVPYILGFMIAFVSVNLFVSFAFDLIMSILPEATLAQR